MTTVFSDSAIDTFGNVETVEYFVQRGRDVRRWTDVDSELSRLKAVAQKSYADGHKVVVVTDHMKRVLYRGVFDL